MMLVKYQIVRQRWAAVSSLVRHLPFVGCFLFQCLAISASAAGYGLTEIIADVQPKIVKVFGAGGFRGLEPYQSGFLISPDGKILTAYSYVLDTDEIRCTLNDGRHFVAKLLGADAQHEVALLKIDADDLPFFDLEKAADARLGTPVLAFSNVFGVAVGDEAASIQHGIVATKTELAARRGTFEIPYRGKMLLLDAMTNNPGAAGGAVTDYDGNLVGILGKEVRNAQSNTWLNYALPATDLQALAAKLASGSFIAVDDSARTKLRDGLSVDHLGLIVVPDVVDRTPPYIDRIRPDSPAAKGGLQPDDLIVSVNGRLVSSVRALKSELGMVDKADEVVLAILRGDELIEITLQAADN